MRTIATLICLGSSLLAAGCAKQADTSDSAADVADSSDSVEAEGNMMMAVTDGADMSVTGAVTSDQVAARIAANVALRWNPSSCATVTSSGSNITIKYDDCTGPRGLIHVTGELDLVASITSTGTIQVTGTATGLEVNRAVLDVNVTATYSVSGTMHSLAVQTDGSGTGPRGTAIEHQGNYTIGWDTSSACGSIAGDWSTDFTRTNASASRSNKVNLMRCNQGCPTGTAVHTGLGGLTLTLTFDGTNVATWAITGGKTGTFDLACQ